MSLDVTLYGETGVAGCRCHCGHEHDREEREILYDANITHNLGRMAAEAGIYRCLWRPEEVGVTKARDLIQPLRDGLAQMKAGPARFEAHNAPNGWGLYKHFVPWLIRLLEACEEYPEATVEVSR